MMVVAKAHAAVAVQALSDRGVLAWEVGRIESGTGEAEAVVVP
jgi:hypothetical protein